MTDDWNAMQVMRLRHEPFATVAGCTVATQLAVTTGTEATTKSVASTSGPGTATGRTAPPKSGHHSPSC